MKKILGLDLGITSIGWAFVHEREHDTEENRIIQLGVRVNPLTTDDKNSFAKGKSVSFTQERTKKRGARRNLNRYKMRRENLLEVLIEHGFIQSDTILPETGLRSTHTTYELRAKAAKERIEKKDLARVLLMINKKRGYKSNRKIKTGDDGILIDSMDIAKFMYNESLTPSEYSLHLLSAGHKGALPDYYRSDLENELNIIWECQKKNYPDILSEETREQIRGKGQRDTTKYFYARNGIHTSENKGTRNEKKIQALRWRVQLQKEKLPIEIVIFVIAEINGFISASSGYLGGISDRSKELYLREQTVGEYLYKQLDKSQHISLKNQVFYRQDYLDEFETIWNCQSQFYPEMTRELKHKIRDIIIFYQRNLKSQKHLLAICEFENSKEEYKDMQGNFRTRVIGRKVIPRSSPLFQEFRMWQNLSNIKLQRLDTKEELYFETEMKQLLYDELNLKGVLSSEACLKILGLSSDIYKLNFKKIEGNRTLRAIVEACIKMIDEQRNSPFVIDKMSSVELKDKLIRFFKNEGIRIDLLDFDPSVKGKEFITQSLYRLWHLLYSYEDDKSPTGTDSVFLLLEKEFGFKRIYAKHLLNLNFDQEYGSLSAKAIRNIMPFLYENRYDEACYLAGYNHSSSTTKEENEKRVLADKLGLVANNSLRNPMVEKILNQMVHVVNQVIDDPLLGRPDEIRVELARELKQNAQQRADASSRIESAEKLNTRIRKILIDEFSISHPTRNDIIKYKLYEELKNNGYKTLYSNTFVAREELFSDKFEIEHIIPKAKLFDDSFSNKTLEIHSVNQTKADSTAMEYMEQNTSPDEVETYKQRIQMLANYGKKGGDGISESKQRKLLMYSDDIGDGFIERDLRNTQYIARKAMEILSQVSRNVLSTTGAITAELRRDWGLEELLKELNLEIYRNASMIDEYTDKKGAHRIKIKDWSKRNDHRHHAVDALTVAFTTRSHIQYINTLKSQDSESPLRRRLIDPSNSKRRIFIAPIINMRGEARKHLEGILVSIQTKNKVLTGNLNKIKQKGIAKTIEKKEMTPRGALHKETVYGRIERYSTRDVKVGGNFDREIIDKVANKRFRSLLFDRLNKYGGDAKKAFTGKNSLKKNPIYLNEEKNISMPEKVSLTEKKVYYTIRKKIDDTLNIDKVIDEGIKRILQKRLNSYDNDAKKAFTNLDQNPIWLNEGRGIAIKRVTIEGPTTVEPLHVKHDHFGNAIIDASGREIPSDYVSTGATHHVAIYRDADGNLQDEVVSFFEAVVRAKAKIAVIERDYKQNEGWQFLFSMKRNEYFVFPNKDFDPGEIDLLNPDNYSTIAPNLFRVQTLSKIQYENSIVRDYGFRHQYDTTVTLKSGLKDIAYKKIKGLSHLEGAVKVRLNHLGIIVSVGEY